MFLKKLAFTIAFVVSSPGFCLYKISKSIELFRTFGEFYSLFPGKFGRYVRACYYHMTLKKCPYDLNMWIFSKFSYPESEVGNGVMISSYCSIGLVTIGDNSVCAGRTSVLSGRFQHNFDDPGRQILEDNNVPTRVYIGRNTFIGEGSIIMSNVGNFVIVGAGSIVIDDIEDYSVVAGNPARVVKRRIEGR